MVANIWDQYVEANARRFGVPPALVQSVIGAESGGRQNAVSPKGAGGYMQIMPNTYAELRQRHGLGEDRFDPANNIAGGTAYLAQLYKQFGNWPDAVAAYNAGPGRVAKVKAGQATLPPETQAYVPKVMAKFGDRGTDMARQQWVGAYDDDTELRQRLAEQERLGFPAAKRAPGTFADATTPETEAKFGKLMGLLDVPPEKNFLDGLGGIWNAGQTPSQPPAPRGEVENLPSQTERLDVTGRMNELMQGLLAPQTRGPSLTPGQYQLAGAGEAVGQLAGITNRKVGFGEILGALGGGLTRGALLGEKAQQERMGSEFDRLGKIATIGNAQRTADLNERNSLYDNRYKQALTQAALTKSEDPKVVGKGVYVNGRWEAAPWANSSDGTGPLEGTGYDAQMTNIYVTLEQKRASGQALTQQEQLLYDTSKRHLMKPRVVAGPDGVVREVAPEPLPTLGGAAPPPPAGGPAPALSPTQTPSPNPTQTPPSTPSRVTDLIPPNVKPSNEQNLNAGFANRLYTANGIFDTLEGEGYVTPGEYDRNVNKVPLVGNYLTSDQFQRQDQAKREFINAQLRRESGAVISPEEFDNANKQYFPQPGDSEAVLAQKRRSRNLAVANMAQSAGPAPIKFAPPKVDLNDQGTGGGDIPPPPPGFKVR